MTMSKNNALNKGIEDSADKGTSSSFLNVLGGIDTVENDLSSSHELNSTCLSSVASLRTNISAKEVCQTHGDDNASEYYDTEICVACLKKYKIMKRATHFCENCDTRGRYICHTCVKDHHMWCPGHEVVSLSVDTQKKTYWRHREKNRPVIRGPTDYADMNSWIQNTKPDDECENGEVNEVEMTSNVSSVSDSGYMHAVSDDVIYENLDQRFEDTSGHQYWHPDDTLTGRSINTIQGHWYREEDYEEGLYQDFLTDENTERELSNMGNQTSLKKKQEQSRSNQQRQRFSGVERSDYEISSRKSSNSQHTLQRLSGIYPSFTHENKDRRLSNRKQEETLKLQGNKKARCLVL